LRAPRGVTSSRPFLRFTDPLLQRALDLLEPAQVADGRLAQDPLERLLVDVVDGRAG
jgi:hypothetical protein